MTVKEILQKELKSCKEKKESFGKKLLSLPKGSLQIKKINRKNYYYIAYRIKSKVKFEYIGKDLSKSEIKMHERSKILRAEYRLEISRLRKQIRYLENVLSSKELN